MSHAVTVPHEAEVSTLSQLQFFEYETWRKGRWENSCSLRIESRQLKFLFHRLQTEILLSLALELQRILVDSKGCEQWVCAFMICLGVIIAGEELQILITLNSLLAPGTDLRNTCSMADSACANIEERLHFMQQSFMWKYDRQGHPIRDAFRGWEGEVGFDKNSADFVMDVAHLVKKNCRLLKHIPCSIMRH